MTPDIINGLFEAVGSVMLWINVLALYKAKRFEGVRIGPTAFFMSWGYWNLYLYPSIGLWWSFAGGVSLVAANTIWLVLMIYYACKNR